MSINVCRRHYLNICKKNVLNSLAISRESVIVQLPKVNADRKSLLCLPLIRVSLIIPQVCFMTLFRSVKVLK